MSNPNESSDQSKPVVKDKNPHNYRKVGYSMIVISVSLVLIGLLVWAIGDNYHFSSDIMANQEIDAMTPKHGYNLVYYDTAQPVGAKLKLLDAASTIEDAQQKQIQYAQQNPSVTGKVIIFNQTLSANQQLVKSTISAITQIQADAAQAAKLKAASQAAASTANQTTSNVPASQTVVSSNATKVVSSNATKVVSSNATKVVSSNATKVVSSNATKFTTQMNATAVIHVLNVTLPGKPAGTAENLVIAANATTPHSSNYTTSNHTKTISLSEHVGLKSP